ncbi:MAG: hypothetical protein FJ034_05095, partial [Chloroflexi bacterium]|nr:hypothetical protein [Chloroflexota bacterium]
MTGRIQPRGRGWIRPVVGAAALALLALTLVSAAPIWVAFLDAPQYPRGLTLYVHGDRIAGDVDEINGLNHYIGMRTLSPDVVPEMRLWPLAPLSSAVLVVLALALRGPPSVLARIGLWAVPLVVLLDIQRWLVVFGRDLDRDAALRLKPFVPLAIGPTKVWNFEIWAVPGPGLMILLLVALAVTIAARTSRLGRPPDGRRMTGLLATT